MQTLCWSSKAAGQEQVWRMAKRQKEGGRKNEAAELLQQFSGAPRFGKRRLHLRASLTGRPPKRKIYFLNFCRRFKAKKKKLHRELAKNYFPLPNCIYQLGLSAGAIVVYGYLLYIENRETYQCHANAVDPNRDPNADRSGKHRTVFARCFLRLSGFFLSDSSLC